MKPKTLFLRIVLWFLFGVGVGLVSVPLALMSEGIAYQYGVFNGTPGLIISREQVPADSDRGIERMGKRMDTALAVDAPIWFVIICGAVGIIVLVRRGRRIRV